MLPTCLVLTLVFSVAALAIYLMFRAIRRKELAEIKRFENVTPTEDDDFLVTLGLSAQTTNGRAALAVRQAIAELGEVPPSSIRADQKFFPDLQKLPFYDSIDFFGLILETESKTNVSIDSNYNDTLYGTIANGTVGDYVLAVLQCSRQGQMHQLSQLSTDAETAK